MKKTLLALFIILVLFISATYILIPGNVNITQSLQIEANKEGLLRKLGNGKSWSEWWPGSDDGNDSSATFSLNGILFSPALPTAISIPVTISGSGFNTQAELTLIALNTDSSKITLATSIATSGNPFKRISLFLKSKKIKSSFSAILQSIGKTYTVIRNLYGYDIQKKRVVDSTLLFTWVEVNEPPSIDTIYSLIDQLRRYIWQHTAKETGHPMLNIYTPDSSHYLVKVAIPVDRVLPGSGHINYRWMLGGGNILVTEVKGGQQKIERAYQQVQHYMDDYQRTAPAIPFESLITDRRQEPDSSKWVTRIYYPVI